MAEGGWAVFQRLESSGGIATALASGEVAALLDMSAAARADRLSLGKEGIVGVTDFPDLAEAPISREPAPTPLGGGLPIRRQAAVFEQLRARSAKATKQQQVVLLTLGAARATAKVAAGVDTLLRPGGVTTVRAGMESPPELAGQVVILCPAPDAAAEELEAAQRLPRRCPRPHRRRGEEARHHRPAAPGIRRSGPGGERMTIPDFTTIDFDPIAAELDSVPAWAEAVSNLPNEDTADWLTPEGDRGPPDVL